MATDDMSHDGEGGDLSAKQEKAVIALLNHATSAKAAEAAGIDERTLRRWRREPAFQAAVRAARRESFDQGIGLAQRYAGSAVQTLVKAMADPNSPHATRVNAAIAVLRFGREGTVIDDLTQRVEVLEGSLADGGGGGKKQGSLEHLTDSELMQTMHESARLARESKAKATEGETP